MKLIQCLDCPAVFRGTSQQSRCKPCRSEHTRKLKQMNDAKRYAAGRNRRKPEPAIRPVLPPIVWPSDAKKPARRASTLAAAGSKPSEAALHRSESLTGAAAAVSYGSRQAGAKACE